MKRSTSYIRIRFYNFDFVCDEAITLKLLPILGYDRKIFHKSLHLLKEDPFCKSSHKLGATSDSDTIRGSCIIIRLYQGGRDDDEPGFPHSPSCLIITNIITTSYSFCIILLSYHRMKRLKKEPVMEFGKVKGIITVNQTEEDLCH